MTAEVTEIWRFPVKGLAAEILPETSIRKGWTLPSDRRFALARVESDIDPAVPRWAMKTSFHMLMHGGDEGLAALTPRFDEASGALAILKDGREVMAATATDADGQAKLSAFFADYLGLDRARPPRFAEAKGFAFGNVEPRVVSLINLASVAHLAETSGQAIDPRRFRGNVMVSGLDPWAERDWVGKTLKIGKQSFTVPKETIRCGATAVNPESLRRDLNVPKLLRQLYGHMFCGVYLEARSDGPLALGDRLVLEDG